MSIKYPKYYSSLKEIVNNTITLITTSSFPEKDKILDKVKLIRKQILDQRPLRIVLIGEFSSGKSSLISALTRENLYIDADVATTDITEYSWKGLSLVDTPGVQAESKGTDHDVIARKATIGADLILFVITNELFNQRLADHLNYVIGENGLGLSKKTAIIVNKFDRETNPEHVLLNEIEKVLGNHQEEIPIYFCSSSKYKQAYQEQSSSKKERFEKQSRFFDLEKGINSFIDTAGTNGKLITPVSSIVECLEQIESTITKTYEEENKLVLLQQKRRVVHKLQKSIGEIKNTSKRKAYLSVMSYADDSVKKISTLSQPEDIKKLFETALKEADIEILSLVEDLKIDIDEAYNQAEEDLNKIGNSPLGKLVASFEKENTNKSDINFNDSRPNSSNVLAKFYKNAQKPLQGTLATAAKNPEKLRNIVYSFGKKAGKKFRPWEAKKAGEKIAKLSGSASKVFPALFFATDIYIQYREEKVKEKKERYVVNSRMELRQSFIKQANLESARIEEMVNKILMNPVQEGFKTIEEEEKQIALTSEKNQALLLDISEIRKSCTKLQANIYSSN